ncbi:uncharacterized protein K489DRAFT_263829 [Dissoconium aciculare CBS 342.82]|uniref:Uncharacterized protein n=1 Tax=Dissoconium aciculare CBS 342.82 TaxID=1314786 RepID=A0A6J3M0M7_9PEZI|nr:uncharacterized protein K489DRAFT_263829 [Dissoconium aciculare CBS 342.82]KAF1821049.1 hypothetical protein K489DRAFT_263829 [Dissoconium aciculare CBS 342.82]
MREGRLFGTTSATRTQSQGQHVAGALSCPLRDDQIKAVSTRANVSPSVRPWSSIQYYPTIYRIRDRRVMDRRPRRASEATTFQLPCFVRSKTAPRPMVRSLTHSVKAMYVIVPF